jgi:hypothetical protein
VGADTTLFINNNINEVVNGANIFAAIGGNLSTKNLTVELLNSRSSRRLDKHVLSFLSFRAESRNLSMLNRTTRDVSTLLDMTKMGVRA